MKLFRFLSNVLIAGLKALGAFILGVVVLILFFAGALGVAYVLGRVGVAIGIPANLFNGSINESRCMIGVLMIWIVVIGGVIISVFVSVAQWFVNLWRKS